MQMNVNKIIRPSRVSCHTFRSVRRPWLGPCIKEQFETGVDRGTRDKMRMDRLIEQVRGLCERAFLETHPHLLCSCSIKIWLHFLPTLLRLLGDKMKIFIPPKWGAQRRKWVCPRCYAHLNSSCIFLIKRELIINKSDSTCLFLRLCVIHLRLCGVH